MPERQAITFNTVGIHYTIRIGIGCTALWFITQAWHAPSPLWAIISLIIVTEPQVHLAWIAFRTRIINTLMGSVVGFAALVFAGPTAVVLLVAITLTALISTYINRGQQGWRIAPITTALVISAGMTQSSLSGIDVALARTFEVFLGSAMALLVSALMARFWLPPVHSSEQDRK